MKIENRSEFQALVDQGADLKGIDAGGVDLTGIDLSTQDLSNAKFRYTDLSRANLQGTILVGANMRHARLLETDLRYVDMRKADLSHADMHGALLGETSMSGAVVDGILGVSTEIFFPMSIIENLIGRPGVKLGEDDLFIPDDGIEQYRIVSAFRIIEPEGGDEGDRKLLGKVLSLKQIREEGGEVAGKSVIHGNFSYRCEEGYIGIPQAGKVKPAAQLAAEEEAASDMDLLKDFLLNKLE